MKNSSKLYTQDQVDLFKMASRVESIDKTVADINHKLDANYVTKDELKIVQLQVELLQKIVYGLISLILTTVVGGGVLFYINSPK